MWVGVARLSGLYWMDYMDVYQLLVVDDHPMLREALVISLENHFSGVQVVQAQSLGECLHLFDTGFDPDLVLLDLNLGDHQGASGVDKLRAKAPDTPILVISAEKETQIILQCLSLGAAGFVLKSQPKETLLKAVELVLAGQVYFPQINQASNTNQGDSVINMALLEQLTKKQLEVFQLLAEGKANKEICRQLNVAETTVKTHVSEILRKLNVRNRTQAALALDKVQLAALLHAKL